MQNTVIRFLNKDKSTFHTVLKERVDAHFKQQNLPKQGGRAMLLKGHVMLSLLFIPYVLLLSNQFAWPVMLLLFSLMGIGTACVGMAVMHDANHGSFSAHGWVNRLFGATLYLLGGNVTNWKRQHNIQHHTYTNIHEADEDITGKPLLRLSFSESLKPIHRYQYVYAFLLYGLMTISFLVKDFRQIYSLVRRAGHKRSQSAFGSEIQVLFISKVVYFVFIGLLPLLFTSLTFGQWLAGFLLMHFTAGIVLSVVFQLAHVVEEVNAPMRNEQGNIDNAWAIHQLHTTSNFTCPAWLSWFIGGLDYQVEHHLFPTISHIHYPKLAAIIRSTAADYGIPYFQQPSVRQAIGSHIRMLKRLGREA